MTESRKLKLGKATEHPHSLILWTRGLKPRGPMLLAQGPQLELRLGFLAWCVEGKKQESGDPGLKQGCVRLEGRVRCFSKVVKR